MTGLLWLGGWRPTVTDRTSSKKHDGSSGKWRVESGEWRVESMTSAEGFGMITVAPAPPLNLPPSAAFHRVHRADPVTP